MFHVNDGVLDEFHLFIRAEGWNLPLNIRIIPIYQRKKGVYLKRTLFMV